MKHKGIQRQGKKSIFRSLFVPLVCIMILQAAIFYCAAVYGGIEKSLSQNAADILAERLSNRQSEIETQFNNKWADLDDCSAKLGELYNDYADEYGEKPLSDDNELQIQFLGESHGVLIDTLRHNEVNGVFLIINDKKEKEKLDGSKEKQNYGLCIRDMNPESNYTDREDLLIERAPSSIIDTVGCQLDSLWEAFYSFKSKEDGDYYYYPLDAAWDNYGAEGEDLAYCSGAYKLSESDQPVMSYSIPLIDESGYPYAVLGIELTAKYLSSLMPSRELNDSDQCCYILALQDSETLECIPIASEGILYNRFFNSDSVISCAEKAPTGGFEIKGDGSVELYGDSANVDVYNNNNPFEDKQLTLIALVESKVLFSHISQIKITLMIVSFISLLLGIVGIIWVSRRFASPITSLAARVRGMKTQSDFELDRLGIAEIDQLVDSIEELNRNVSKNSARTEFFSRMSHDMRTPMNAIISFSSPVLLENATEKVKDSYLDKIHDSGKYLLELINEVLDMTKIESNQTELCLGSVRADKLFGTVIPIIEKIAQNKGVKFSVDMKIDDKTYLLADEQHLNQILMNLLSNAVKFTAPERAVKLDVSLSDDQEHPDECAVCRLVVSDEGIGMSEKFMENLYSPFEQENTRQEGTGLGLSITKKLVELMQGAIECESVQGEGTTFTVNIPLMKTVSEEEKSSAEQAEAELDYGVLRGKRILVCEDNAINTQIICKLLEKCAIETVAAADGQEGVDTFAASEAGYFDGILMDIRMPVMDGIEASKMIRALPRDDAGTVAIIAMTANAFEEDVRACLEAGMDAHLSKPVEMQKFYATLIKFLSK